MIKMHTLSLPLFLLLLVFISFQIPVQSLYRTLVTSINKDSNTSLYSLNLQGQYVIDINAPFLWYICAGQWFIDPLACTSAQCKIGRTYLSCPSNNIYNDGQCICQVTPVNPITKACRSAQLTFKSIIVDWTNGINPTVGINFNNVYVSCAPTSMLQALPQDSAGVAGLSWSELSLINQFTLEFMSRKFALCLPDTPETQGVIFFGDGPYNIPFDFDVTNTLSYTPLLRLNNSQEYYIGINGISIDGEKIDKFNSRTFEFDSSGHGGVMLSTIVPYTTFRSDIYSVILKEFSRAAKGIPRGPKVHPFDFCLKTRKIGSNKVGLSVPQIDLELRDGATWKINEANSMKQVGDDLVCLAFVDGGMTAERAVVIGSYQMENNFLLFDVGSSRLGLSSSLLFYNTSCGNFNFTVTGIW